MAITIATLAADLKRYHILYDAEIKRKISLAMTTEANLTPVICERSYTAPNVKATDIVQKYQWQFTPKGDAEFDTLTSTLEALKIDIQLSPDQLDAFHDSWMTEWVELGKSRLEWSFPRYLWENVFLPKYEDNMERKIAYSGVAAAGTAGTAGTTEGACNGLGTNLAGLISANKVVPFVMGARTPSTTVAYLEDFCARLPLEYRYLNMPILCSPETVSDYYFDRRAKFGQNTDYKAGDSVAIPTFNKTLVPLPSMSGKSRLICTPKENAIVGFKRGQSRIPVIRWQEDERILKGLAEFHRFYSFKFADEIFTNDVV